ncbi:hypothetical protein CHRYSEO8AT_10148 [Chryseobacterium sp. 8AT]|nr:hypothetical protein CHRYSEO8AT_10148 [Chryseobacterium sp. 8AT]
MRIACLDEGSNPSNSTKNKKTETFKMLLFFLFIYFNNLNLSL